MPKTERITSDIVISRLPHYLRTLRHLREEQKTIISKDLANIFGYTAAQVRKDLSQFGEFGKQGKGYNIDYLIERLEEILQVNQPWNMILVGFGNVGHGILNYYNTPNTGFNIVSVFDIDPNLIGKEFQGIKVRSMEEAESFIRANDIKIALLAVPGSEAQNVANHLIDCGVRGILTYAARSLVVPPEVQVRYIDPISSLQHIAYYLQR